MYYLSRGESRTLEYEPLEGRKLRHAPHRIVSGDPYVYVVTQDEDGGLYVEGFRAVAADFLIAARHQSTVYGPTTSEGVRAFFAGRRHNMGGGVQVPDAYHQGRRP